jgi:hypothetical protein
LFPDGRNQEILVHAAKHAAVHKTAGAAEHLSVRFPQSAMVAVLRPSSFSSQANFMLPAHAVTGGAISSEPVNSGWRGALGQ